MVKKFDLDPSILASNLSITVNLTSKDVELAEWDIDHP